MIKPEITIEKFTYKGFVFQRLNYSMLWHVIYNNEIVNYGKYQNDLKEWVDIVTKEGL